MQRKLPMLFWMQAYYGFFKLLSLRDGRPRLQETALRIELGSGDALQLDWGEVGMVLSLFLLLGDLVRAFLERDRALGQHLVSFGLFTVCVVLLMNVRGYFTASFLIYLLSVLCDLIAGVLILLASRRDLYPHHGGS
jgi:hypothetical protein